MCQVCGDGITDGMSWSLLLPFVTNTRRQFAEAVFIYICHELRDAKRHCKYNRASDWVTGAMKNKFKVFLLHLKPTRSSAVSTKKFMKIVFSKRNFTLRSNVTEKVSLFYCSFTVSIRVHMDHLHFRALASGPQHKS